MRSWLRFGLAVVVLLPAVALAQDKKELTLPSRNEVKSWPQSSSRCSGDTQNLRLPENRAFFLAQIGNLLWPVDQGRALGLFQNAASELISAQDLAESKRSSNPNNELLNGGSTRQQILNTVAACDARLAVDLLVSTRPVAIQKAMLAETHPSSKISNDSGGYNYLVQNERSMEQNFYRMAADQDPEHAVQLLKESLAKNLSNETYYQLERLADKDTSAAGEMASLTINKLMAGGYMSGSQPMYMNIQLTNQILSNAMSDQVGTERKLKFDSGRGPPAGKQVCVCLSLRSTDGGRISVLGRSDRRKILAVLGRGGQGSYRVSANRDAGNGRGLSEANECRHAAGTDACRRRQVFNPQPAEYLPDRIEQAPRPRRHRGRAKCSGGKF